MKALLFNGYEKAAGLERVGGSYRLATKLRKEGWNVEVIDYFYLWSLEQLQELIKLRNSESSISWIGFSCTWVNYSSYEFQSRINDFLKWVKVNYPNIIIMAGGQNPSLHFPMYDNVDYIISGYGEVAVLEVLKYIYSNGKIKGIPRKNGWLVDANSFYPAWPISDLSIDYEFRDFIHPGETLSLEFSRGCKFSCAFCNFPILGVKEDTTRDVTNLEYELKRNYDLYGITNYQVADETLNDRDEKLEKIGRIVKGVNADLNFNAFIRADILFSRPQQLELLAEAGVWGHYYGIESFNYQTAKSVGKGMHPDKIKQGLIDTEKYFENRLKKFRGTISLIYGLPFETEESISHGLQWLKNNWNRQSVVAFPLNINLTGNKSKIDKDYEKYGYKILKEEKRNKLFHRHNFFPNDMVIWENENINTYNAIDLVNRQLQNPWRIDSWQLWGIMGLMKDLNLTVADLLNIVETQYLPDLSNVVQSRELKLSISQRATIIKHEYIEKKLSL